MEGFNTQQGRNLEFAWQLLIKAASLLQKLDVTGLGLISCVCTVITRTKGVLRRTF